MKYAIVAVSSALGGVVLGSALGALVALLFAPTSGKELRTNIKNGVDPQVTKAKDEWQKRVQDVQDRVEKVKIERKERKAQVKDLPTAA
jgi:gas vesicle protein